MSEEDKVICPVCDQVITDFDEGISDPCEHVILSYVDMLSGEFVHVGAGAEKIAEKMLVIYEEDDDADLIDQMEAYVRENDGYDVISLTTSGLACGPVSSTESHLIKMK